MRIAVLTISDAGARGGQHLVAIFDRTRSRHHDKAVATHGDAVHIDDRVFGAEFPAYHLVGLGDGDDLLDARGALDQREVRALTRVDNPNNGAVFAA